MKSYRLLFLNKNGHLVGSATIDCLEDRQAIAAAERETRKHEYVEVWNGGRPVCICAKHLKQPGRLATLIRRIRLSRGARADTPSPSPTLQGTRGSFAYGYRNTELAMTRDLGSAR